MLEEKCLWKVDSRIGVGIRGCDGGLTNLSDVDGADYCIACTKPLANVQECTDLTSEYFEGLLRKGEISPNKARILLNRGIPVDLTFNSESPKRQEYKQLLDELLKTYEAKNSDYGDSFSKVFRKRGMLSALISLEHKLNRLETLTEKKNRVDESMRDTLMDMAGYCLMTVMELDNTQKEADFIRDADEREMW